MRRLLAPLAVFALAIGAAGGDRCCPPAGCPAGRCRCHSAPPLPACGGRAAGPAAVPCRPSGRPGPRLGGPARRPTGPGCPPSPIPRNQRGVSLGLFAEDVSFDYAPLLAEIAALGATHVALVVPLYQEHGGSTQLAPAHPAFAQPVRHRRGHPRRPPRWAWT